MKWTVVCAAATALLVLSGCTSAPSQEAATPSPETTPTLADPIELDYHATLIVDDGAGHALVSDWSAEKVRAIDSAGEELWSIDAQINDDPSGGAQAYSAGENVIIDDYSGEVVAYSWADGSEAWSFDIPDVANACHPAQGFGSQTTGTSPILGDGDLILLAYEGMLEEDGCEPTSEHGNALVLALDPATGEEAWPSLSTGSEGKTFGGTPIHVSPDRQYGIVSWQDGDESVITRVALDTGRHTTVPITSARSIDDTGVDHFDVYPTSDPNSLLYVYGSEDPDNPYSSMVTRAAQLSLPSGLPESDAPTLDSIGEPQALTMKDTLDAVCATDLAFSPNGEPACVQPQLFASTVKYQGSVGSLQGWYADAPEVALESIGTYGAPQNSPIDAEDETLVVVPGVESGVMALNAETGKTVWEAGDSTTSDMPWGGQGVFPELGLVIVTDNKKTSFYESDTGKLVDEHPASEYAQLRSGKRVALVAGEESTTMWSVVES